MWLSDIHFKDGISEPSYPNAFSLHDMLRQRSFNLQLTRPRRCPARRRYRPLKPRGGRFSVKARAASWKSSVR